MADMHVRSRKLCFLAVIGMEATLLVAGPALRSTPLCHCSDHQAIQQQFASYQCHCCTSDSCEPAPSASDEERPIRLISNAAFSCPVRQFLSVAKPHVEVNADTCAFPDVLQWRVDALDPMLVGSARKIHEPRGPPSC
ncbi:MAG: hypothetical protein U1D30_01735 [Planctomycetota bacterium]